MFKLYLNQTEACNNDYTGAFNESSNIGIYF